MIAEDKVTKLFCMTNDFCKFLMQCWQNIRLTNHEVHVPP